MKRYFHITRKENLKSIKKNGLTSNKEGDIFLFEFERYVHPVFNETNYVINHIAENQAFIDGECILIEVNPAGFENDLFSDDVAEFTARWQWILKQPTIKPEFIINYWFFLIPYNENSVLIDKMGRWYKPVL